eukprot:1833913-Pyramimonas_sp.AAC.1
MKTCDTTLCHLHPRAGLRPHTANPNQLHSTTTCKAIGLVSLPVGSHGLLSGARWDTCVAETTQERPAPIGTRPAKYLFREFAREVHAWINVTTGNMAPSQQAAALQRGAGGLARTIAKIIPPAVITFGVNMGGRHTDGGTYIMFLLSTNSENLEEERQLNSGTAPIDF